MKLGWNNRSRGKGFESTRQWRDEQLAEFLKIEGVAGDLIAEKLVLDFPGFRRRAHHFLQQYTGITHFYPALRQATLEFIRRHYTVIGAAFSKVSQGANESRITEVAALIVGLGRIKTSWGTTVSPLNGLTPTMACLDPRERFPIMNKTTRPLLRALGQEADSQGAVALYRLIGRRDLGITSSFELDVYSVTQGSKISKQHRP